MKVNKDRIYGIIIEEYLKEEGLIDEAMSQERADEFIAWIKGEGEKPDWLDRDYGPGSYRRKKGGQSPMDPSVDRAADTMPFPADDIPSDDAPERDVSGFQDRAGPPLEDQLMDLIQGLPPEEVADLFQAVFEKIPGVELGDPEEEPPETLYSPGAEGRPQVGFREQLMEIIKEELQNVLDEKENNPWAICTASVGREDKEKYEKCVMGVKKQNRGKK